MDGWDSSHYPQRTIIGGILLEVSSIMYILQRVSLKILSPIVETLSADVEILSSIGEILSLNWEILAGILFVREIVSLQN